MVTGLRAGEDLSGIMAKRLRKPRLQELPPPSDPSLVLRGIDNVQQVASMIDNARRDERRKRGLYMETV